jgi:predicted methyltransferase
MIQEPIHGTPDSEPPSFKPELHIGLLPRRPTDGRTWLAPGIRLQLFQPASNCASIRKTLTMTGPAIKQEALAGFAASSAYDTHRPSYPAEAVSQLLSALKVAGEDGAVVADLAAGTGKFTELLAARPEHYSIFAIEPHEGMRAELERKQLNGVKVVKGTAEDMSEIADATFDALIASQVRLHRMMN